MCAMITSQIYDYDKKNILKNIVYVMKQTTFKIIEEINHAIYSC